MYTLSLILPLGILFQDTSTYFWLVLKHINYLITSQNNTQHMWVIFIHNFPPLCIYLYHLYIVKRAITWFSKTQNFFLRQSYIFPFILATYVCIFCNAFSFSYHHFLRARRGCTYNYKCVTGIYVDSINMLNKIMQLRFLKTARRK